MQQVHQLLPAYTEAVRAADSEAHVQHEVALKTARLTSGKQRARVAAFNGALQNIPDRVQHCSAVIRKDTISCAVELSRRLLDVYMVPAVLNLELA